MMRPGRGDSPIVPLAPRDRSQPAFTGTGFAENAVYFTIHPPLTSVPLYGSWLNTDQSTGVMHTRWYPATKTFSFYLAGYPLHAGNRVLVEVRTAAAGIVPIPLTLDEDPGDVWRPVDVSLASISQPLQFRIVAIDGSTGVGGWVGVSDPFLLRSQNGTLLKQLLLVLLAAMTDVLILLGPGFVLRDVVRQRGRSLEMIWLPVPGFALLVVLGLLDWMGPHGASPRLISRLGLWVFTLTILAAAVRRPLVSTLTLVEKRVLVIVLVLAAIGVAKSTYSVGPLGELYRDQISHSLEVGGRSDSRVCYHVIQLISQREAPFGAAATRLLAPWNFSHRGPLAALASAPLVLAGPVRLDTNVPNQPSKVFDEEGFAAYRVAMILLAACCLFGVFGVARQFLPDEWSWLAVLVTASAPFVVHEIYFTWPKLLSASYLLLAGYLALRTRYFWAGFILGIAYLCHPSALLCLPGVVAAAFLTNSHDRANRPSTAGTLFQATTKLFRLGCGLLIWLAGWRWLGGSHYEQAGFLRYFQQANGTASWIEGRRISVANTLVPLNLYLFHRTHQAVNAVGHISPPIVQFSFAYWTSLPFGAGIAFFLCMLPVAGMAAVRRTKWFIWIVAVPFLVFAFYWGADSTGLLREGLHAWFFTLMICSVAAWKDLLPRMGPLAMLLPYALLLRFVGLTVMLFLVPVLSRNLLFQRQFFLSDIGSLVVTLGGSAWLCWQTFWQAKLVADSPIRED